MISTHLILIKKERLECYKEVTVKYEFQLHTLTNWFSSIFLPFSLRTHAWVSKSIASTLIVSVVRTLLLVEDPVDDSFWTFL